MENKEVKISDRLRQEFLSPEGRIFSKRVGIKREILIVLTVGALVSAVVIIIICLANGYLLPMTDNDIQSYSRIKIKYSIPFWWNIGFGIIWTFQLYWMYISPWLEKQVGKFIKVCLIATVFVAGLSCSIIYGGIFYGLILSLTFVTLLCFMIFTYPWIIKTLFY